MIFNLVESWAKCMSDIWLMKNLVVNQRELSKIDRNEAIENWLTSADNKLMMMSFILKIQFVYRVCVLL